MICRADGLNIVGAGVLDGPAEKSYEFALPFGELVHCTARDVREAVPYIVYNYLKILLYFHHFCRGDHWSPTQ